MTRLPTACVIAISILANCSCGSEPSGGAVSSVNLSNDQFQTIGTEYFLAAGKSPDQGTNHTVSFNRAELAGKPKWNVGESTPPISANKAILLSVAAMNNWFAGRADLTWKIQSIELVPIDVEDGLWIWRINTEVKSQMRTDKLPVVIDMDGSILTELNTVQVNMKSRGRE